MSGKMSAEWWRAYRLRRAESLREYNRQRRKTPKLKAQRAAAEIRRRARRRILSEGIPPFTGHPVLDEARALVKPPRPGNVYQFHNEVEWEDSVMEAALALLEGRDPGQAIQMMLALERKHAHLALPLFDNQ